MIMYDSGPAAISSKAKVPSADTNTSSKNKTEDPGGLSCKLTNSEPVVADTEQDHYDIYTVS